MRFFLIVFLLILLTHLSSCLSCGNSSRSVIPWRESVIEAAKQAAGEDYDLVKITIVDEPGWGWTSLSPLQGVLIEFQPFNQTPALGGGYIYVFPSEWTGKRKSLEMKDAWIPDTLYAQSDRCKIFCKDYYMLDEHNNDFPARLAKSLSAKIDNSPNTWNFETE